MRISSTFHFFASFMAVLIFSMPFIVLAQENSVRASVIAAPEANAEAEAVADANKDVNRPLWFGTGCLISGLVFVPLPSWYSCLLPPAGLTGTYFYQPDPPLSRLIGKSPEYVAVYTQTYKSKRGDIQARWASAGCVSGGAIVGALIVSVGIGVGIGAAAAALEE